jgi:pyridoxine 5-phosphate synthase
MKEILLGVNIDHIATLRNARGTAYPDPVHAAEIAERAGADGITVHLREDRRHIHDRDVQILKQTIQTRMNLEMAGNQSRMNTACERLTAAGILVSLFVDADKKQIDAALEANVPFIEIHTGQYAEAKSETEQQKELAILIEGIEYAHSKGLRVNAGHGLHYHNVKPIAAIPELYELNIGHAIIARAAFDGLHKAVTDMRQLMQEARA